MASNKEKSWEKKTLFFDINKDKPNVYFVDVKEDYFKEFSDRMVGAYQGDVLDYAKVDASKVYSPPLNIPDQQVTLETRALLIDEKQANHVEADLGRLKRTVGTTPANSLCFYKAILDQIPHPADYTPDMLMHQSSLYMVKHADQFYDQAAKYLNYDNESYRSMAVNSFKGNLWYSIAAARAIVKMWKLPITIVLPYCQPLELNHRLGEQAPVVIVGNGFLRGESRLVTHFSQTRPISGVSQFDLKHLEDETITVYEGSEHGAKDAIEIFRSKAKCELKFLYSKLVADIRVNDQLQKVINKQRIQLSENLKKIENKLTDFGIKVMHKEVEHGAMQELGHIVFDTVEPEAVDAMSLGDSDEEEQSTSHVGNDAAFDPVAGEMVGQGQKHFEDIMGEQGEAGSSDGDLQASAETTTPNRKLSELSELVDHDYTAQLQPGARPHHVLNVVVPELVHAVGVLEANEAEQESVSTVGVPDEMAGIGLKVEHREESLVQVVEAAMSCQVEVPRPNRAKPKHKLKYICDTCGHQTCTETGLKEHNNAKHLKRFTIFCDVCKKGFYYKSALSKHRTKQHGYKRKFKAPRIPAAKKAKKD